MKRLAIISTHPIQYNAPWFALLAKESNIKVKVFYTWSQRQTNLFDTTFGKSIEWDIPLLDGYEYTFVENISKRPGTNSFWGIKCPGLIPQILNYSPTHILIFGWNFQAHFKAMKYFKGHIPVLFRGDSTLLDYDIQSVKSILTDHSSFISNLKSYIKFKLRVNFLSYIYKHIDKALYVGQANKDYFKSCGLKETQLKFVPHAIDNNRFKDNKTYQYEEKAQNWRRELYIKEQDIVVLYAGKFEPRKNPILLAKAFNIISNKYSSNNHQIKLIMVGNGPLENQVKNITNKNSNIILLPFQNQTLMPVVYRLCNLFCLSSVSETWGLAVNEALASGRPVLLSDKVGCAADLVHPPSCMFKSGNLIDLTQRMEMMIQQIKEHSINKSIPQQQITPWSFEQIITNIKAALD